MMIYLGRQRKNRSIQLLSKFLVGILITGLILPPPSIYAQVFPVEVMPAPGVMINTTTAFHPPMMRGLSIYPNNPLMFDFIIEDGDTPLQGEALKEESRRLIKYFLAALTVPDEEMWVNLSPYEKDQMISPNFGLTEMGRDLLAQDYLLKQLTASLMYPEKELGKEFWKRVYDKVYQLYGTTDIPLNTFNKVWIVPDKAVVYEQGAMAFVGESHLKVMLEQDYLSLQKNLGSEKLGTDQVDQKNVEALSGMASEIVREVLIPEIEKEVNEGKTFANLRQIYNSVILASWYKDHLKESLLGQVYVGKNKIKGVDAEDPSVKEKIYQQYVEAFKKGVYDYLKEDYDPATQQTIVRQYFSGGIVQSVKGAASGAAQAQGTDLGVNGMRKDLPITPDQQPLPNGGTHAVTADLRTISKEADVKAAEEDIKRVESKLEQVQSSSPSVSVLEEPKPGIYQNAEGEFYGMMGVASNPLNGETYALYTKLKDDSGYYPADAVFLIKPLEQFRSEGTAETGGLKYVQPNIEGEVESLLLKRAQFDRNDGYRLITRVKEDGEEYIVYQYQVTGALLTMPWNKFFNRDADSHSNETFFPGALKSIGLAGDLKPISPTLLKKWKEQAKAVPAEWSNEDAPYKIIYAPEVKGSGRLAFHFRDDKGVLVIVFDSSFEKFNESIDVDLALRSRIWRHEIEEDRWQQWLMTRFSQYLVYQDEESERILERTAHILATVQGINGLYQPLKYRQELSLYDIVMGKKDRAIAMLPEHVYDLNTKSKEELLKLLKEDRSEHNKKVFNLLGRVHTAWRSDVHDKNVVRVPPGSYQNAEEFYLNYVNYELAFKEYVLQLLRTQWGLVALSKEEIKEIKEAYATTGPNEKQLEQWESDEFSSRFFDPIRQKEFFAVLDNLSSSQTIFEDRPIPSGIYKDRNSEYRSVVGQATHPQTNEKYIVYMVLDEDQGRYRYPGNGLWQMQPVEVFSAEVRSEGGNLLYVEPNEAGEDQLDELYRGNSRLVYTDQEDQYYVEFLTAHYKGKDYAVYRKLDGGRTLLTMPEKVFEGKVNKKLRFRYVGTTSLDRDGIDLLPGLYKDLIENDPLRRDKFYDVIGTAVDTESPDGKKYALYIHPTNDIAPKKTLGNFMWITDVNEFLWTTGDNGQSEREPRVTFLRESRGENKPLVEVEELIVEKEGIVAAVITPGFYREPAGIYVYEVLGVARDSKDAKKEYVAYRVYDSNYMVEGSGELKVMSKKRFRETVPNLKFLGTHKEDFIGGALKSVGLAGDLKDIPSELIEKWRKQAKSDSLNKQKVISHPGLMKDYGRLAYNFQETDGTLIIVLDSDIAQIPESYILTYDWSPEDRMTGGELRDTVMQHEQLESRWRSWLASFDSLLKDKKDPKAIERAAHFLTTIEDIYKYHETNRKHSILPAHRYDLNNKSKEDLLKLLKEDRAVHNQDIFNLLDRVHNALMREPRYSRWAPSEQWLKDPESLYLNYLVYELSFKDYVLQILQRKWGLSSLSTEDIELIEKAYRSTGVDQKFLTTLWNLRDDQEVSTMGGSLKSIGPAEDLKPIPPEQLVKWEKQAQQSPGVSIKEVDFKQIFVPGLKKQWGRWAHYFRAQGALIVVMDDELKKEENTAAGQALLQSILRHEIGEDGWQTKLLQRQMVESLIAQKDQRIALTPREQVEINKRSVEYSDEEAGMAADELRILQRKAEKVVRDGARIWVSHEEIEEIRRKAHFVATVEDIHNFYRSLKAKKMFSSKNAGYMSDLLNGQRRADLVLPMHRYDLQRKSDAELIELLKEVRPEKYVIQNLLNDIYRPQPNYRELTDVDNKYWDYLEYELAVKEYIMEILTGRNKEFSFSNADSDRISYSYRMLIKAQEQDFVELFDAKSSGFPEGKYIEFAVAYEQNSLDGKSFEAWMYKYFFDREMFGERDQRRELFLTRLRELRDLPEERKTGTIGGSLKSIGRPEDLPPVPSEWIEEWKQQARSTNATAAISEKGVYFHRVYDARLRAIGRMAYHFQDSSVGLVVVVDPGILKFEMADIADIGQLIALDMVNHEIRENQWQQLVQMMIDTKKIPSLTKEEIERAAHTIVTMEEIHAQYVFLAGKESASTIFLEGKFDSVVLPPHQYDLQKRSNEDLIKLLKEDRSSNHQWVVQQILPYLKAAKEAKAYGPLADHKAPFFKSNETEMYVDYVIYTLSIKEYIWHILETRGALDALSADELQEIGAAYLSSALKQEELEKLGVKPGSILDKALGSERQLNSFTKLNDYVRAKAIENPQETSSSASISPEELEKVSGILGITQDMVERVEPEEIASEMEEWMESFQKSHTKVKGRPFGTNAELKTKLQNIAEDMIEAKEGEEWESLNSENQDFLKSIWQGQPQTLPNINVIYFVSFDPSAARYAEAFMKKNNGRLDKAMEQWRRTVRQVRANRSAEIEQQPSVQAKPAGPGGIDLNPALFDLQIKRDGNGIPLPVQQQPLQTINIQGFLPIIINVVPVSLPALLGSVDEKNEGNKDVSLQLHPQTLATIREPFQDHEFAEVSLLD